MNVGRFSSIDYMGTLYVPSANQSICEIDFYISGISGTLDAGRDYYCQIYTVDGNGDVDALVGTSAALDAQDVDSEGAGAWFSATNAGRFVFATPVAVTNPTLYALVIVTDTDSDITDNSEVSATYWIQIGADNEADNDAVLLGQNYWTWDAAIPYADAGLDSEDDVLIKVHTMQ